jgi:SAM-dependent methyltransferase
MPGDHYAATREVFRYLALHRQGYYDAAPGGPLRHSRWQRRVRGMARSLLDELLSGDRTLRTLVDVGCGRGDFLQEIAGRYPQLAELWGTDLSPEMLALAAAEAKDPGRVFLREADVRSMPFESGRFDVAVCVNVLHHVHERDQDRALGELGRITRRHLILEIKNRANPYYRRIVSRCIPPLGRLDVFPTSVDRIDRALAPGGFRRKSVRGLFWSRRLSPLLVLRYERG